MTKSMDSFIKGLKVAGIVVKCFNWLIYTKTLVLRIVPDLNVISFSNDRTLLKVHLAYLLPLLTLVGCLVG